MEEGAPPAKRAKQGDGGETEAPSTTSTGASQKHEISLNISGVTLGRSPALDGELVKLREGVDASLAQSRTVHGEITKVREGMDANRNEAQAIRDEIAKLNSQLELQNSKLDFQTKMQTLAFAIQNAEANSFNYEYLDENQNQVSSKDLVRSPLLSFRRGFAHHLPSKKGRIRQNDYHDTPVDARLKSQQAFRDKLSIQIHELTGVKPRFEFKKEDEHYWVYYS
jgi:hypothetical protein